MLLLDGSSLVYREKDAFFCSFLGNGPIISSAAALDDILSLHCNGTFLAVTHPLCGCRKIDQ